jgi:hypothetical protein
LWSRPSPKLRGPRDIPSRTVPDICDDVIQERFHVEPLRA